MKFRRRQKKTEPEQPLCDVAVEPEIPEVERQARATLRQALAETKASPEIWEAFERVIGERK